MKYTVYALVCPVKKQIRYIGVTSRNLKYRLLDHINQKTNLLKFAWVLWLKKKGLRPVIKKISGHYTKSKAYSIEEQLIEKHRGTGQSLNIGPGSPGRLNRNKIPQLIKKFDAEILNISMFDAIYKYNLTKKPIKKSK